MTGLRRVATRKLPSSITPVVPQQNMSALEGNDHQWDAQRIVDLANRSGTLQASVLASDGFPKHLAVPTNGFGQFVRVTSTGAGSYIRLDHTLGVRPQGLIWIKQPTGPSYLVMASSSASGGYLTTQTKLVVYMAGPSGEEGIGLIF